MRITLTVTQMLVRVSGVLLLILGLLIWTQNMRSLIGIHILLGVVLVLALVVFAAAAQRAGAPLGMAIGLAVLAVIVLVLGVTQGALLPPPDSNHWIVEVVHLLLGLSVIGLAEVIGGRLRRMRLAHANP